MAAVSDVFFKAMARAILTGFMGNPRLMGMMTRYTDLVKTPGTNRVDVPVWSSFTIKTMNSECLTPCETTKQCDAPVATILTIELITQFVPTPICLGDLNIMTDGQKGGMVARIIQDLIRDFEIVVPNASVWDVLFTDSVFNGPGGSMTPILLADTAAGYRQLASAISLAKGKDAGSGVVMIASPDLDAFIRSIPNRDIDRIMGGVTYIVCGNAAAFAANYWGTTYTGKIGYVYPKDALAYAAPGLKDPNLPLTGYAGNFWSAALDDTEIPGKMWYFAHQYGLMVVRRGDVQMLIAP